MQKWNILPVLIYSMLFLLPSVLADDTYATLRVKFKTTLGDIGDGIGSLFLGMSPALAIFLILVAIGSMVGYILASIARRTGGMGGEGYQRPV